MDISSASTVTDVTERPEKEGDRRRDEDERDLELDLKKKREREQKRGHDNSNRTDGEIEDEMDTTSTLYPSPEDANTHTSLNLNLMKTKKNYNSSSHQSHSNAIKNDNKTFVNINNNNNIVNNNNSDFDSNNNSDNNINNNGAGGLVSKASASSTSPCSSSSCAHLRLASISSSSSYSSASASTYQRIRYGNGMGSDNNSNTAKGLECPICLDIYNTESRTPMVLACGHSLCVSCVDTVTRTVERGNKNGISKYQCPFCNRAMTATKNFALLQLLELEKGKSEDAVNIRQVGEKECEICFGSDDEEEEEEETSEEEISEKEVEEKGNGYEYGHQNRNRQSNTKDSNNNSNEIRRCGNRMELETETRNLRKTTTKKKPKKKSRSKKKICAATVYCLECEQAMCDRAARIHSRTRISREHTVIPIDDVEFRKKSSKTQPLCPFHNAPIEYLCLEDDCLLCIKCLPSPMHNGHRCKPIPEALQDENKYISDDLIQQGRNKVDTVSIALKNIEETIDGVEESAKKVRIEIEDYITTLTATIEEQKALLLDQVEEITEGKLKILCSQAESLRGILEALVNGCVHLESVEVHQGQEDFNEARDLIMKRSFRKGVGNNSVSLSPESLNDLGFVSKESLTTFLSSIGEVTESGPTAFQSTSSGPGISTYYALSPNGASFIITTKTRAGELVRSGGATINVHIDSEYQPEIQVVDNQDGTYEVNYSLQTIEALLNDEYAEGENNSGIGGGSSNKKRLKSFNLRVQLNKKDIAGSPFQVMIRRDYNYVLDRNLMGIGLVSGGVIDAPFMYVALYSQQQIVKVRIATGLQEQRIAVDGQPYAMVVEDNLLYVCLYNTHWVAVYNKDTGILVRRMGGPGQLINPVGMAMEGDLLYVTEHLGHRVRAMDKVTGEIVQARCIEDNTLQSPFAIYLDETFIYVSSNTGNHVKVYNKESLELERTVGNAIGTFLQSPISLAMDDDILFVGCNGNNIVQLYRKGSFEPLGTIHNVMQPYSATTHEKLLYVCCMGNSQVSIYKPSYLSDNGTVTGSGVGTGLINRGNEQQMVGEEEEEEMIIANNNMIPEFDLVEMEQEEG